MGITRREMLKLTAATAAATALPLSLPRPRTVIAGAESSGSLTATRIAKTACIICGQKCPVEIHVAKVGGKEIISKVVYNRDPEYDQFFAVCGRPQTIPELRFLPERIRKPLLRVGKRGEGKFKEISWEEAFNILAERIKKYMDEPWRIVAVSHQGFEGGLVREFFKKVIGTPNTTQHCDTCHTGMDIGHKFIFGSPKGPSAFQPDYANADLVVLMGRNPAGGIVASAWSKIFTEGRANKMKLVVFDVRESRLTELADKYYIIPPGTDLAIALALLNVILNERLYNVDYLINWTNASMLLYVDTLEPVKLEDNPYMEKKKTYLVYDEYDQRFKLKTEAKKPALEFEGEYNRRPVKTVLLVLKDAVKEYTPEWAEKITGVPAEEIRWLAHEMARAAPRTFIDHNYKATRYYNEGMFSRAKMLVNVLLGSVGVKGGLAYPAGKPKFKSPISILGIETTKTQGEAIYKYWSKHGVENVVSKCWSQLLVKSIIEGKPYPIGVLFIHLENLVAHALTGRRLAEALKDEKRVEFIVVLDTTFNETVMYADLVLPVPFFFEAESITLGYAKKSYVSIVVDAQKAVDPPEGVDARPTWWILVELAKRLGKLDQGVKVDPVEVKKKQAEEAGLDYNELREKGYKLLWTKPKYHPWGGKPLATVTGELELINVAMLESYRDYIGKESPLNPLPCWVPPLWMRKGTLADNEFVVVEYQDSLTSINTFMRFSRLTKDVLEWKHIYGVLMHPSRAKKLGIKDGDMVKLKGPNGEIVAKVRVTEAVHPYVLAAPHATAVDKAIIPGEAVIETAGGTVKVKLFSNGGGYGVNNNFLGDPLESVVPEEGYRAAQHDFVVKVEKL
ncbi:anaerobic dehydrogenase [Pyrodictium delaneyi]|uniref:Anaerobic dehydrogenase n=1 Tax=Pyrodictium delaneyi TaxID=1273541 RepID=A0A0N7JD20_9CREN|nr:molybdopterin-dependent oxidoreductase [Pyrodictium delaneyi]ALL00969.1 anaerobic dehydrogenase [Pyrodictium delaneyi]